MIEAKKVTKITVSNMYKNRRRLGARSGYQARRFARS